MQAHALDSLAPATAQERKESDGWLKMSAPPDPSQNLLKTYV